MRRKTVFKANIDGIEIIVDSSSRDIDHPERIKYCYLVRNAESLEYIGDGESRRADWAIDAAGACARAYARSKFVSPITGIEGLEGKQ